MTIDLRSDTVTRPTPEMLNAMTKAEVGDDVFGEDPTINQLQEKVAEMFGKEAALFCPSGTMTNQTGIKAHTQPGDEVICDASAHVYQYEGGGIGFNSGCSVKPIQGQYGQFGPEEITASINPPDLHKPLSSLVVVENTSNRGGGHYWSFEKMKAVSDACKQHGLKCHLDGARFFNAVVEEGYTPKETGALFDSISICLSKGLGAPIGSVLTGNKEYIHKAARARKVMGGGMRQAGFLAAAGIYALDHHIERLKEDHQKARKLGDFLRDLSYVQEVVPVQTNIIIFRLIDQINENEFLQQLSKLGIKGVPFGPGLVRFVTHLDITDNMLERTFKILRSL